MKLPSSAASRPVVAELELETARMTRPSAMKGTATTEPLPSPASGRRESRGPGRGRLDEDRMSVAQRFGQWTLGMVGIARVTRAPYRGRPHAVRHAVHDGAGARVERLHGVADDDGRDVIGRERGREGEIERVRAARCAPRPARLAGGRSAGWR